MRRLLIVCLAATSACFAAEPSWNPAEAVKDAEKDIKAQHVQFYWSGSIAVFPVGVPIEFAKQYPRADAGVGCVTNDIPLREKQEKYARRYNEKMYDFVSKNPEIGKLKITVGGTRSVGPGRRAIRASVKAIRAALISLWLEQSEPSVLV